VSALRYDDPFRVVHAPKLVIALATSQSCESRALGERSATRAIVRVRTRLDARTRLSGRRLTVSFARKTSFCRRTRSTIARSAHLLRAFSSGGKLVSMPDAH
jgi:hypothetical protein